MAEQWTPGAGWERLKQEAPHLAPELTDEDMRKATGIIAAARAGRPDQAAAGATASHCPRRLGPHAWVTHTRGGALVSVSRCSVCGWIDFDDLYEQALALIEAGRRQATEGWEREWAVELPSGDDRLDALNEKAARWFASRAPGRGVVSRLAGPWEPAEQPGDELLPLTMEGHVHVRRESPAEIAREVGEASDVH